MNRHSSNTCVPAQSGCPERSTTRSSRACALSTSSAAAAAGLAEDRAGPRGLVPLRVFRLLVRGARVFQAPQGFLTHRLTVGQRPAGVRRQGRVRFTMRERFAVRPGPDQNVDRFHVPGRRGHRNGRVRLDVRVLLRFGLSRHEYRRGHTRRDGQEHRQGEQKGAGAPRRAATTGAAGGTAAAAAAAAEAAASAAASSRSAAASASAHAANCSGVGGGGSITLVLMARPVQSGCSLPQLWGRIDDSATDFAL
ncbi:hypothetical protein FTUN_5614 [Frigoriglobus tundricola]|uniref:Uncharacterized protein n=1 Tax=Frigoriglobus tundricola TaxID=2774151 RepID=A0A6M5YX44_9BACT|nr:hypothetical protein FTUN_5614 [Frigoriglobus tundricola]